MKKAEHWRIDAFKLWCWRRFLRVPWIVRRSNSKTVNSRGNQLRIFIGRTDAEAEAPILWPPDAKSWLTGEDPDTGRLKAEAEERNRGWDSWMTSPSQWTWTWANSGIWWGTGKPGMLQSMGSRRVRHDWMTEQQQKNGYEAGLGGTSRKLSHEPCNNWLLINNWQLF